MDNALGGVIRQIIEIGNEEIFHDVRRFNALLDDLAPDLVTERRVFHRAMTDEVLLIFEELKENKNGSNEFELLRIKGKLENDYGLSESWSIIIVSGFADAFAIKHSFAPTSHQKSEQTVEQMVNPTAETPKMDEGVKVKNESASAPSNGTESNRNAELLKQKELLIKEKSSLGLFSFKRKAEIDKMLSDIDRELGFFKKETTPQSGAREAYQPNVNTPNSFELIKMDIFSSDGTVNGKKLNGPIFMSGETTYVGIKVQYKPQNYNRNATLRWRIYKENGMPFTNEIKLTLLASPAHDYFTHQWGWPNVGNWYPGKYKIIASVNGSESIQGTFEVKQGKYDFLASSLKNVRLFNGSVQPPPLDRREYTSAFSQSSLRYVYFQIEFEQPNRPMRVTFDYMIKNQNGDVLVNSSDPYEINTNDCVYWNGYGWAEPGNWSPGKYTYVVRFGKSNPISGTFIVN